MEESTGQNEFNICLSTDAGTATGNLQAALLYARNGWPIFPVFEPAGTGCSCGDPDCKHIGKHPRIQGGLKNASTDADQVTEWWTRWPSANIALRLDRLLVLDVDPRNGGDESLNRLQEQYGGLFQRARQRTGSGGTHYLFASSDRITKASKSDDYPGLDLLTGVGCYILVAPSIHACGGTYEWTHEPAPLTHRPGSLEFTEPFDWVIDIAVSKQQKTGKKSKTAGFVIPDEIGEGQRDSTLTRAAGKLRRNGFSPDEILAALRQMNAERCKPPLDDRDLTRIANSIGKKDPAPTDDEAIIYLTDRVVVYSTPGG